MGILVTHTSDGMLLTQTNYVIDLLFRARMQYVREMNTLMTSGQKLFAFGSDPVQDLQLYRSIVGALQYVTIIRPEIPYSVNRVCQFMQAPSEAHWQVVKRILRYLAETLDYGLHLQ